MTPRCSWIRVMIHSVSFTSVWQQTNFESNRQSGLLAFDLAILIEFLFWHDTQSRGTANRSWSDTINICFNLISQDCRNCTETWHSWHPHNWFLSIDFANRLSLKSLVSIPMSHRLVKLSFTRSKSKKQRRNVKKAHPILCSDNETNIHAHCIHATPILLLMRQTATQLCHT